METNSLGKNLREILNYKYIIPLYQRNFAWREEEISQLLQDIYDSYEQSKHKSEKGNYYIGSLVVMEKGDGFLEVIDGQQRLTVITLMAKILDNNLKESKLSYLTRTEVNDFYSKFYNSQTGDTSVIDCDDNNEEYQNKISHFIKAIDIIRNTKLNSDDDKTITISTLHSDFDNFKRFFFQNVILTLVKLPKDTDVAAYFEIMNNRGRQLQKHEILKAKLLNKLKTNNNEYDRSKQRVYAQIWDACSQMNTHIQKLFDVERRKILFGDQYDDLPTKTKIEELIPHQNRDNYDEYSDFISPTGTLLVANQNISNISISSGMLGGAWINQGKPKEAIVLPTYRGQKSIDFQMQTHDDNYAKGIKIQLFQENNGIYAKIIWAKASKKKSQSPDPLIGKNWDHEEYVDTFDQVPVASSVHTSGYGVCKIVLEGVVKASQKCTITSILSSLEGVNRSNQIEIEKREDNNDDDYEDRGDDNSIIDFPNFIMHILKLKYDSEKVIIQLNDKYLLTVFDKLEIDIDPEEFISALLFYRTIFDRYVVKLTTNEKSEEKFEWTLEKPYKNKYENRLLYKKTFDDGEQERIKKCMSMLQATYNGRTYKNWLQNVLSWFLDHNNNLSDIEYRKKLDKLALHYSNSEEINNIQNDDLYARGTNTPHYLFNFIDYLYWVRSEKNNNPNEKFVFEFRSSRNSVEHHLPQSQKDGKNDKIIDCLGNLCLVSNSTNSKMSDQEPVGKALSCAPANLPPKRKTMYLTSCDWENRRGKSWGEKEIANHYQEVVDLLKRKKEILE